MPRSEKNRVMISSRRKATIPYKGKPVPLSELRKLLQKDIESLVFVAKAEGRSLIVD